MADEPTENESLDENESLETPEPHGGGEPDYKALYEAEKAHSRKWERQSKANKLALDTAEEKVKSLTAQAEERDKADQRTRLAEKVASEKGVPAHLIVGDTEEEMAKWADQMLEAFKKPTAAKSDNPGKFADTKTQDNQLRDYVRQLTGSN